MVEKKSYWMRKSISITNSCPAGILRVGAVLVDHLDHFICSAYSGEQPALSWSDVLIKKLKELNVHVVETLFLSVNSISSSGSFEIEKVLSAISISEIYFGLPDPHTISYSSDDCLLSFPNVHRYPDALQINILQGNASFYDNSPQSIKHSPYYYENRISHFVLKQLKSLGIDLTKEELDEHKSRTKLANYICKKAGISYSCALESVNSAIAEAFRKKYGLYDYKNDTRSLSPNWIEEFRLVYQNAGCKSINTCHIIDIGVGSGNEALSLFSNCQNITFVDVAFAGLDQIKQTLPSSSVFVSSASNLSFISDNEFDLYVSLRTFNSSFFDIEAAVEEAFRVLKPSGIILLSIANGFSSNEQERIIPGLIIPGTEFVDIYRGMNTINKIRGLLVKNDFWNIQVYPTITEIYITATMPAA